MRVDDAAFLDRYDAADYDRPSLAVDLVLMSVVEGALAALLMRRDAPPQAGRWALPGGFVAIDESLDTAARRILADKAQMADAFVEQLYTFGEPGRDPRTRIVSVAYFALLPSDRFADALAGAPDLMLARLATDSESMTAQAPDGKPLPLAFDHAAMLGLAVRRLRGRLDYSPIAFALLPDRFTLRALQDVHEAILGRTLNKPAFRRRLLDSGWLRPTGDRATGTSYRPPELYRCRAPEKDEPPCP